MSSEEMRRGDTLKWINDILDYRKQAVVIKGMNSEKKSPPASRRSNPESDTALYLAISSTTENEVLPTNRPSKPRTMRKDVGYEI